MDVCKTIVARCTKDPKRRRKDGLLAGNVLFYALTKDGRLRKRFTRRFTLAFVDEACVAGGSSDHCGARHPGRNDGQHVDLCADEYREFRAALQGPAAYLGTVVTEQYPLEHNPTSVRTEG